MPYVRNGSFEMESVLSPGTYWKKMRISDEDRFVSEGMDSMRNRGQSQIVSNTNLERDDIRHTRRFMDMYSNKALMHAAEITRSFNTSPAAVDRIKKYMTVVEKVSPTGHRFIEEPDQSDVLEWTPDRFRGEGWKYQAKGTHQVLLNHPNKINGVGGYGTCQSIETLKKQYLPDSQQDMHTEQMIALKEFIAQMNDHSPTGRANEPRLRRSRRRAEQEHLRTENNSEMHLKRRQENDVELSENPRPRYPSPTSNMNSKKSLRLATLDANDNDALPGLLGTIKRF